MIAIESFQKFSLRDAAVIGGMSAVCATAQFGLQELDPRISPHITFVAFSMLLTLCTLVVRKAGTATGFALLSALLSFPALTIGISGWEKVLALSIAGVLFELVFLTLKIEVSLIPLDVVVGAAIATASIPVTSMLLLAPGIAIANGYAMMNIGLLGFTTGMIGAVLAFLLWHNIRMTKVVLWFEYGA